MKKYLKKILVLTLILTLCTTTMLSGTLAKFVDSDTASTTAISSASFDLSLDDNDSGTTATSTNIYGTSVDLYPGSTGYIEIKIDLTADVDAQIVAAIDSASIMVGENADKDTVATVSDTGTTYAQMVEASGLRFAISSSTDTPALDDFDIAYGDWANMTSPTIYYDASASSSGSYYTSNASGSTDSTTASFYVHWFWAYDVASMSTYGVAEVIGAGESVQSLDETGSTLTSGTTYYSYTVEGAITYYTTLDKALIAAGALSIAEAYGVGTVTPADGNMTVTLDGEESQSLTQSTTYYSYTVADSTVYYSALADALAAAGTACDTADSLWGVEDAGTDITITFTASATATQLENAFALLEG